MSTTILQKSPWITFDTIKPFLPDKPIILEAGAHSGKDTIRMKKFWPHSTIHVFEPIPSLFAQLQKRTQEYSEIFCYNTALANQVGTATMYLSSGRTDACSSLLPPQGLLQERPDIVFEQTITVPTTTIDTWAQENNIDHIDFMWLDLQGTELSVLQGAPHILTTVRAIHTEINETERYTGNVLYTELQAFLEQHGFRAHLKAIHKYGWGNALFVKE